MIPRCTADERGFSLIELLVATAIFAVIFAGAVSAIRRTAEAARAVPDLTDRVQALRIAASALARDLERAGGSTFRPFSALVPAIFPERLGVDPEMTVAADRVTVLYAEAGGGRATLAAPMLSGDQVVPIDFTNCASADCGFRPGTRAILVDAGASDGAFDLFTVAGVDAAGLHRDPVEGPLSSNYGASAFVSAIVERSYFLDRTAAANVRLMRSDAEQPPMPVAEGVDTMSFEFYGAADPGALPVRVGAGLSCAFAPGTPPATRLAPLPGPGPSRMPAAMLADGPLCGAPGRRYDADLLRVRRVRVLLGIRGGWRGAPPLYATIDVAPSNLGLVWP